MFTVEALKRPEVITDYPLLVLIAAATTVFPTTLNYAYHFTTQGQLRKKSETRKTHISAHIYPTNNANCDRVILNAQDAE